MLKIFYVVVIYAMFSMIFSVDVNAAKLGDFKEETQAVKCLNRVRTELGLKRVAWHPKSKLQTAAELRAQELEKLFSHTRPNGLICFTALRDSQVFKYKICGENIAYGINLSAEGATELWCNSPEHYKTMTIKEFKEVGLASWHDDNGNVYWVQLFIG